MNRKQKKELRQHQSTRQLMGIEQLTEHGIKTARGELIFYLIKPDNLSVLSDEGVRGRVLALTNLLCGTDELYLLALDSRESFQQNKNYYHDRLDEEELPALRELLRQDMAYVFEAPIDLLSFISLYPKNWQQHSYVALCGTSRHALLWMLEQNDKLDKIVLCMDHDETGIEVNGRLADTLREAGYSNVSMLQPVHKDWNEDLKARHGMEAQAPVEHPQLEVAPEICRRIGKLTERAKLDTIQQVMPWLLEKYCSHLHWGRFDQAMTCMEQMAALSLAAYGRERNQLGDAVSAEELTSVLQSRILPHQNRGVIKTRDTEIRMEIQSALAKGCAEGIRTETDKRQLAEAWLCLAVSCAKIPVKYEADLLKQQQKQKQTQTESAAECPEQQMPSAMSMAQQMM